MPDFLFILLLALIIFGPKRLPEVARKLGGFMAQFRMMRDDLTRQIQAEMVNIEREERGKQGAVPAGQLPPARVTPPGATAEEPPTDLRRVSME